MWPKFGNSSIYMREVIIMSISYGLKTLLECDKRVKTKKVCKSNRERTAKGEFLLPPPLSVGLRLLMVQFLGIFCRCLTYTLQQVTLNW